MNQEIKDELMDAVRNGNYASITEKFNEQYIDLTDDSYFDYELLKAAIVSLRDIAVISFLVSKGCRVNNERLNGAEETPLHLVAKHVTQNIDGFVWLLASQGASVYAKNAEGDTPVQTAFKVQNLEALRSFFEYSSPNVDPSNRDDLVHFHIACVTNSYFIAERYLTCGFDPNVPLLLDSDEYAGLNPIQFSIKNIYMKLFRILMKFEIDLSVKNEKGLTPLHMIYYTPYRYDRLFDRSAWLAYAFKHGNNSKYLNKKDERGLSHFHLSCMLDNPALVQVFIDSGAGVNTAILPKSVCSHYSDGFTPLHFAVQRRCRKVVRVLLENGADPNKPNCWGETPLQLVCKCPEDLANLDIIKILLDHKASPAIADKNGYTPLHTIFNYENRTVIFLIFDALIAKMTWGRVNYTDKEGLSLFHIACASQDIGQVKRFLRAGVDVHERVATGKYRGCTAMHFAVMYHRKEVVEMLLAQGADVNVRDGTGATPLHYACEFSYCVNFQKEEYVHRDRENQMDIIKLLISHGADVDAVEETSRMTPLLHACTADTFPAYLCYSFTELQKLSQEYNITMLEIVRILIFYKANVNARAEDQSSILHLLSKYRESVEISENLIKFLLDSGADINAVNKDGLTPLHVAVENLDGALVSCLLKHKANPNIKCRKSNTPIVHLINPPRKMYSNYSAINDGYRMFNITCFRTVDIIFNALLENGSDVNVKDENGKIILHLAMEHCNASAIEKILHYGADVNANHTYTTELLERESREHMNPTNSKFFQIFIHVQKLLALGLPVKENLKDCCTRLFAIYRQKFRDYDMAEDLLGSAYDKCTKELNRMKRIKVDGYTSLYQFLLKSPQELTKCIKNKALIKIIKDPEIEKNYPMYAYLLSLQVKRGSKRSDLLPAAITALFTVLKVALPDSCYDAIFKHLDDQDFQHLIEVATKKCKPKRKLPKGKEAGTKLVKKNDVDQPMPGCSWYPD